MGEVVRFRRDNPRWTRPLEGEALARYAAASVKADEIKWAAGHESLDALHQRAARVFAAADEAIRDADRGIAEAQEALGPWTDRELWADREPGEEG